MSVLTYLTHDVIIDYINGASPKVGLLTAKPNGDGTGVSEPNNIYGYTRQDVTFGSTIRDDVNARSIIKNSNSIVFGPVSTQAWPTVTYIGLFDDDDNLLAYSPLAASRTPPIGDTVSFGANAIQFRFN